MGWNTVEAPEGSVLLKGVENERFYFVHSFAAMSASPADTSADQLDFGDAEEHVTWCTYGRSRFVARLRTWTVVRHAVPSGEIRRSRRAAAA